MDSNNVDSLSPDRRRPTIRNGHLTSRHRRSSPGLSSRTRLGSEAIMYFCISFCLVVCAAWHWSMGNLQFPETDGFRSKQLTPEQRKLFEQLTLHFTVKLDDVRRERWWTLITPAFSHIDAEHISRNLLAFITFSTVLLKSGIDPATYGLLILGSAVSGNLVFLYQASLRQPTGWAFFTQRTELQALGLSGVVMGPSAAVAMAAPRSRSSFSVQFPCQDGC